MCPIELRLNIDNIKIEKGLEVHIKVHLGSKSAYSGIRDDCRRKRKSLQCLMC